MISSTSPLELPYCAPPLKEPDCFNTFVDLSFGIDPTCPLFQIVLHLNPN